MQGKITDIKIERSSLIISYCDTDKIYLQKKDGAEVILPSFCNNSEAWFNLASCFKGKCFPQGDWLVEGALYDAGEPLSADFSKGSCRFAVDCHNDGGQLVIHTDYSPTKTGLRDKITTFGLRLPYNLGRLLRGKGNRILFASETRQSLSGNMECVVSAAEDDFGGNKVICSFKKGGRLAYYLKTAFLAGRCHTVVVDDYFPLIYRLDFKGDRVIQLWHACGAFKTVGYSRLGKSGAPQPDDITHRNYTHVTVSGEEIVPYYAEAFGISADKLIATGVPRTDVFFDEAYAKEKQEEFFDRFPQFKGRQIVIFAPTFRGDGFNSAHYPREYVDFDGLADFCRNNNSAIIFKMHPFIKDFVIPFGYEDVFEDATEIREINDLLFAADLLITDYSSVIYEYSLLNKPLVFYTPDMAEYCASRDLYMPFEKYAGDCAVFSSDGLLNLLNSGEYKSFSAHHIREGSMSACDGNSSIRVAQLIFNK